MELNNINNKGAWSDIAASLNQNFLKILAELLKYQHVTTISGANFLGYFTSSSVLPNPAEAAWAVAGNLKAVTVYAYYTSDAVPNGFSEGWNALSSLGTYDFTDYSNLLTKVEETDAKVSELGQEVHDVEKKSLGITEYNVYGLNNGSINNSGNTTTINTPKLQVQFEDVVELNIIRPSSAEHYCYGYAVYDDNGNFLENIDITANRTSSKRYIRFENAAYIRYAISESDGVSSYNPIRVSDFNNGDIKVVVKKGYNIVESQIINLVSISDKSPSIINEGESYFNTSTNKVRKCISVVDDLFITIPSRSDAVYYCGDYIYRWDGTTLVKAMRVDELIEGINNGSVVGYSNKELINKQAEKQTEPYFEIPECGMYELWEPDTTTDEYVTPNDRSQVTIDLTYQEFLDKYFNIYIGKLSDGYTVTRKSLGYDASGVYEIFEYDFIPRSYNRMVMLSAGMNAVELSPIFGIAYFLKSLFDRSINDEGLNYIYNNVKLKIIPILCPWSFSQETLRYGNFNDVNINRNFNYNNQWGSIQSTEGTWNYKGESPESEVETRLIKQWMIDNAKEADCYIDCHSDVGATNNPATFYTMVGDDNTRQKLYSVQNKIKSYYTNKGLNPTNPSISVWKDGLDYPKIPYAQNVCGLTSIMIEQYPSDTSHGGTGLHNDDADIKNYVLMIRAYMLALLRREKVVIEDNEAKVMLYQLYRSVFGKEVVNRDSLYSFGGFNNQGQINESMNRMHTDYIPVNGGDHFYIRFDDTKNIRTVEIAQYDANKSLVNLSFTVSTERTLTLNASTKYVRCSIKEVNDTNMVGLVKLDRTNSLICVGYKDISSDYELKKFDNATNSFIGEVKRLLTPLHDVKENGYYFIKSNNSLYTLIDVIGIDSNKIPVANLTKIVHKDGVIVNVSNAKYVRCTMMREGNTYIRLFELWETGDVSIFEIEDFIKE